MSQRDSKESGELRDSKLKAIFLGWKHTIMNIETTDLHPDFVRMYEEAKEFGKTTKSLIERIRHAVQPHSSWQKNLIPPSDEYTDIDLFVETLNEVGDSLKAKAPKLSDFCKKESKAFDVIGKEYGQLLCQIKANTIKSMEKYLDEDLEQIKNEYDKLIRFKKMFDEGRNKLKSCKPDKIEENFSKLNETKTAFENQANFVTQLLRRLPEHMENLRKALRQFALAHRVYFERSDECVTRMLQETKEGN